MATSNKVHSSLAEHQVALVWGAWVELGVSGWQTTHADWAIDPEPLIIATASITDADPRLRDEALDWCIHNWRYVSRTRLKNLLRDSSDEVREAWGPFAATVSHHAGARVLWPGATDAFRYTMTGRSSFESMAQPSRAWVRLRGMFGLGARTEIIRYFLSRKRRATVAAIARSTGYAKRNVAEECDTLAKAGVLRSQQIANRFYYTLADRDALEGFVGEIAPVRPDWPSLFAVTNALVALEALSRDLSDAALMVEAHRVAQGIDADLDRLGIDERPSLARRENHWSSISDFGRRYMGAWAVGEWEPPDEGVGATTRHRAPTKRVSRARPVPIKQGSS
jgi:hypothetical protein